MNFLLETLRLGLTNLGLHKLRSLLTALGIIFGVAAVITMVAIGEGNRRRALADIQNLGSRNIIVRSVKPQSPPTTTERRMLLAYGLHRKDLRRIEQTVRPISRIVPLKLSGWTVSRGRYTAPGGAYGTTPDLIEITSLRVERGRYLSREDLDSLANVAVIGAEVAQRLFPLEDPIGQLINVSSGSNRQAFRVVGVLRPVGLAGGAGSALVGRDLNFDVHIPMTTATARFSDMTLRRESGSMSGEIVELTELYIEAPTEADVKPVAEQVARIIEQEHPGSTDITMIVPLELLEQAERTQRMFNYLMVAIASISLLVGGIGIMNIMLASVTERTREIGIRRALGATRRHIIAQFLVETTTLSGVGGLIGVGLGVGATVGLALLQGYFPAIEKPHVTPWSIVASFIVAASVGVIFGVYPAMKAAQQDPIVALRHD